MKKILYNISIVLLILILLNNKIHSSNNFEKKTYLCSLKLNKKIVKYYINDKKLQASMNKTKDSSWNRSLPKNFIKGIGKARNIIHTRHKKCNITENYFHYFYRSQHEHHFVYFVYGFKLQNKDNKKVFRDIVVMINNLEVATAAE